MYDKESDYIKITFFTLVMNNKNNKSGNNEGSWVLSFGNGVEDGVS